MDSGIEQYIGSYVFFLAGNSSMFMEVLEYNYADDTITMRYADESQVAGDTFMSFKWKGKWAMNRKSLRIIPVSVGDRVSHVAGFAKVASIIPLGKSLKINLVFDGGLRMSIELTNFGDLIAFLKNDLEPTNEYVAE